LILVAGGEADPNLATLLRCLDRQGVEHHGVLVGPRSQPTVHWDCGTGALAVDREGLDPSALFIRHDVFGPLAERREEAGFRTFAWYSALMGWALANEKVRLLNRRGADRMLNKPHMLSMARAAGLEVPDTVVTNDLAQLRALSGTGAEMIAKPVAGGTYTQPLDALLTQDVGPTDEPAPAIVQPRLVPPELRLFRIGERFVAFDVQSAALDYRTTTEVRLDPVAPPVDLVQGLRTLTDRLGLDFVAADFKTCPHSGRLLFLEVNNAPMFAAFDHAAHGEICAAIIEALSQH